MGHRTRADRLEFSNLREALRDLITADWPHLDPGNEPKKSFAILKDELHRLGDGREYRNNQTEWFCNGKRHAFSAGNGKLLAYLERHGRILDTKYEGNDVHISALIEPR